MSTSSTHKAVTALPTNYREPESPSSIPPRPDREVDNRYLAGDVIGDRYRLVKKLGEGGMGVVWVAHSLVLGVDIALKLISASAAGRGVASRMAREAHAAARLGHPALVRVFDFGWTTRGDPYLVMELAQGETLSRVLHRESRIGAVRAVQLLLPICDGIRCAHEKGIIHRDIKPENVFLAADPFGRLQPKLLDFGIAKMDAQQDGRLTQVGAVLGSPEFMSPEQARGAQDIDSRTDVWSTAVMLYEMTTGVLPFKNQNYNALMQAILHDEPKPTTDFRAGDTDLWRVISKGLAKQPEERWESMTAFGEALALWLYEHGVKEDVCGNSVRALWLDTTLSGVRIEVDTGAPPAHPTRDENARPSMVATVITEPTLLGSLRMRAKQYKHLALRRSKTLGIAGLGVAAGVGITLYVLQPKAPTASEVTRVEVAPAAPKQAPPKAAPKPAVAEPAASSSVVDSKATPETSPAKAPLKSQTAAAPAPKAPGVTRSLVRPKPKSQPRSIRDFGF